MTYGSFGWAMDQRAQLAQKNRDREMYDAQTRRMIAGSPQPSGGGKQPAQPQAPTAKPPTFSNISVVGSGIGVLPNAFGQASPAVIPINEGQAGSGSRGRTMFSTDAAGGVTVPERAGYQTDDEIGLKEGGFITRIKDGIKSKLGVLHTPKQDYDQQNDAGRIAGNAGGMLGNAARAIQSRPSIIQEEMKRQGFKKGTEYVSKGITKVKDKTGNGSPTEDTVDAKLAEGEAVLNAGAAELIGREGIAELNKEGLKEMGMEGAEPEFIDGEVRAYAGIDFNDPAMKANAQNMEMRRRMAAGVRQPVAQPSAPVQAAPAQAPAAIGDPYTKEELVRNAERAKAAQAAQAQAAAARAPTVSVARPSIASRAMNVGGKALRVAGSATAAGIMAMLQSGEAGAAADDMDFAPRGRFRTAPAAPVAPVAQAQASPVQQAAVQPPQYEVLNTNFAESGKKPQSAAQTFAARGVSKEDRSNYDLAEQGFGGIVRKAGNVYTDSGKNPYLDQQFKEQDGLTGKQLMERRIATDESRRIEAAAKEEQAKLDALEAADPRVRVARIEQETAAATKAESAAEKKAAQDAAVNYAREQNPNLTKAQETAIRYGVKDVGKNDAYKIEMGEVAQALGIPAVDDEGKPISDVMTGRQVVNRNIDAERKFFAWMKQSGIKDTNQGLALYLSSNAGGSQAPKSFASTAEVEAAAAAGQIKPGDKVIVNGRQATWQ